ncbi:MAG: radical SAM family heme chaperone HemW [Asticcacaulis sp.]|nr:radical SAM family heme chaperone HemW [Asticcacaulis sp.]
MASGLAGQVALYVHWPYCARICPYCDFNVTRDRGQASQRTLFDALLSDLRTQAALIGPRRLASIFFGGGTPSLLPPEWVGALIATAQNLFAVDDIEITLEANPTDAEIGRYRAFHDAGVNRLSLGVQSLDDSALKFLGRNHSAREAVTGIETAQSVFGRVSLDLIYARPGQSVADWRAELAVAAHLGVEHLSPYQLTIEPGTAFGRAVRRKLWSPPEADLAEAFYFETQSILEGLGFEAYEISNHARGETGRSAHNVNIWRGVDYIGIGPGAHGRLTTGGIRTATTALSDLKAYVARVAETGTGHDGEPLSPLEAEEEAVMLGLRMAEGVALHRVSLLDLASKAAPLIADGFMELTATHLRATRKGRVVLDRLIMEVLT